MKVVEVTEREAFSKMLIGVGQVYGKSISPLMVKLYWEILKQYDLASVVKAVEGHVKDADVGQFMPKPADLIRILKGDSQTQSLQAWTKVEQAIRLVGPYRSVAFDEPVIHAVLQEMGGWIRICQTSDKELPFMMKEFQNRYRGYRHGEVKSFPRHLAGISEHQNLIRGHSTEQIALIGNKEKAKDVMNGGVVTEKQFQVSNIAVGLLASPDIQYDCSGES
jgi:hypothetical protein